MLVKLSALSGDDFLQQKNLQCLQRIFPREVVGELQRLLRREPTHIPRSDFQYLRVCPPLCAVKLVDQQLVLGSLKLRFAELPRPFERLQVACT